MIITHREQPNRKSQRRSVWQAGGKPGSQSHEKPTPLGIPPIRTTEETIDQTVKSPGGSRKTSKKGGNKGGNNKGGNRGGKRS